MTSMVSYITPYPGQDFSKGTKEGYETVLTEIERRLALAKNPKMKWKLQQDIRRILEINKLLRSWAVLQRMKPTNPKRKWVVGMEGRKKTLERETELFLSKWLPKYFPDHDILLFEDYTYDIVSLGNVWRLTPLYKDLQVGANQPMLLTKDFERDLDPKTLTYID